MNVEFGEGYVPCNCAICKRPFSDRPFETKVPYCKVGHTGGGNYDYAVSIVHPQCLTKALEKKEWR